MSYAKTTWVNDSTPYLNATNLNKIEEGIEDAHTKIGRVISPIDDYSAAGDGTTDDTSELQAAINAADEGTVIDGGGNTYLISSTLTFSDKIGVIFQNFKLKADSSWTAGTITLVTGSVALGNPMIQITGTAHTTAYSYKNTIKHCRLDGNQNAPGIGIANGKGVNIYSNVIENFVGYGIATKTKAGELRICNNTIHEWYWGESGYTTSTNRVAYGVSLHTPDAMIYGNTISYCARPLNLDSGSSQIFGNHLWNDGADGPDLPNIVYEENATNCIISNNTLDNGYIHCKSMYGTFRENDFLYSTGGLTTVTEMFKLEAGSATDDAAGLVIENNHTQTTTFITLVESGGNAFSGVRCYIAGNKKAAILGEEPKVAAECTHGSIEVGGIVSGDWTADGGVNYYTVDMSSYLVFSGMRLRPTVQIIPYFGNARSSTILNWWPHMAAYAQDTFDVVCNGTPACSLQISFVQGAYGV